MSSLVVAVQRETGPSERRVSLVPDGVSALRAAGLTVLVQAGAGAGAYFADDAYAAAGAQVNAQPGGSGWPGGRSRCPRIGPAARQPPAGHARVPGRARQVGRRRHGAARRGATLRAYGPAPVTADFERWSTIVALVTHGDTPYHWVRAGQALQRVLLTATTRRLAAAPVNQALEIPRLRRLVTDHYAQAILRIGYGEPVPATPRRHTRCPPAGCRDS